MGQMAHLLLLNLLGSPTTSSNPPYICWPASGLSACFPYQEVGVYSRKEAVLLLCPIPPNSLTAASISCRIPCQQTQRKTEELTSNETGPELHRHFLSKVREKSPPSACKLPEQSVAPFQNIE